MIALIDADSLIYVIGYNYREHMDDPTAVIDVERSCDDFVKTILTIVQADSYIGSFSSNKCFRNEVYKVAPYKGTRKEKPDWVEYWSPIIKKRLIEKWNFFQPEEEYTISRDNFTPTDIKGLEADDIISALVPYYGQEDTVVCSPDKDMKQIPGIHYDYKREGAAPVRISSEEANRTFWMQMMCGDVTDNIKGVPGLGEMKAKKLLDEANDPVEYGTIVMAAFCKYYGDYYGPIIYNETLDTVKTLGPTHRLWKDYEKIIYSIVDNHLVPFNAGSVEASPFDDPSAEEVFGSFAD